MQGETLATRPMVDTGGQPCPLLRVRQLTKAFGSHHALRSVDIDVERGEVVCVIGASGSGKSTFLRSVNFLTRPDSGSVELDGDLVGYQHVGPATVRPLTDRGLLSQQAEFGFVFQSFNLFPHLTAIENITLGPVRTRGDSVEKARAMACRLLKQVGLSGREESRPHQLSGGQQQRVAIARALAMQPKMLLLDEPTSALDPELVGEVLHVVKDLAEQGVTMLIVTHEMNFALEVADRVVFFDAGRVEEVGTAKEVLRGSSNPRVKTFLSRLQ